MLLRLVQVAGWLCNKPQTDLGLMQEELKIKNFKL
jgi:hypothetical protein